jgi:obg-like ATPase 1
LSFASFRLIKIKEWVDKHDPGALIVPFSGVFESKIADMSDDEKKTYQKEQGATR